LSGDIWEKDSKEKYLTDMRLVIEYHFQDFSKKYQQNGWLFPQRLTKRLMLLTNI